MTDTNWDEIFTNRKVINPALSITLPEFVAPWRGLTYEEWKEHQMEYHWQNGYISEADLSCVTPERKPQSEPNATKSAIDNFQLLNPVPTTMLRTGGSDQSMKAKRDRTPTTSAPLVPPQS
jgi:hypothetical protein